MITNTKPSTYGEVFLGSGSELLRDEIASLRAKNADLLAQNADLLAQNADLLAQNADLRSQNADLTGQVGALSEKVATLAKLAFGASSEKKPAQHGNGQNDDEHANGGGCDTDKAARRPRGQQPGSKGHGRRDYSKLPTTEEIHDIPADERVCPHCDAVYAPFGTESCEQIDWQVSLTRIMHRRPKYRRTCRCAVPGVLVAPPPPKAIAKGRFTTGFLARLLVEKFVLGRPVHRIVAALDNDGLQVSEGTLAGVFADLARLLAPLAEMIAAHNRTSAHLHADETRWQVFAEVQGKTSHRWWLWVFVGADTTVFRIAPTRSFAVLIEHLGLNPDTKELPTGRELVLSSDFYTVYQSLGTSDQVDNLWCWAHMRRYFIRAGDADRSLADWARSWVELIGALYAARAAMDAATPDSAAYRDGAAAFWASLERIDTQRRAQGASPGLHPRAAKVLATLDREWEGLARHQRFADLPLDNNAAERALRNPVIGRKNYYGSGSVVSAQCASATWTIAATAGHGGLNVLTYLNAYLDACAQAGSKAPEGEQLARFAPWAANEADLANWRAGPTGPAP